MKKVSLIVVMLLAVIFTACNNTKDEINTADKYKAIVQEYIDKGDVETAKKALEEGIKITGDESLKKLYTELTVEKEAEPEQEIKKHILAELDQEERRTLNVFLSNFSEARMTTYSETDYTTSQLIEFAFSHNNINNPNKILYSGNDMGLSYNDANTSVQRYFGKTLPREGQGEWKYLNDGFYKPAATGESYALFSVASDLIDNNDGTFDVSFSVFFDENNMFETALPEWYYYTIEQAQSKCSQNGSGTAKIRSKIYNGKDTYELINYSFSN